MKKIPTAYFVAAILLFLSACSPMPPSETDSGRASPDLLITPTPQVSIEPEPTVYIDHVNDGTAHEPSESPAPTIEYVLYKSRANSLNIRSSPDASVDGNIIGELEFEDVVSVVGESGDFYTILMEDGSFAYCYKQYLCLADEVLYGYLAPITGYKTDAEGNVVLDDDGDPIELYAELVDVRLYVPTAEIYQIFATENNVTGAPIYRRPVPVLQRSMAEKLRMAAEKFAEDGYTIKIYDLYRPYDVQFILYDIVQNGAYISNPYTGASNHNRAGAIDMTLIGPDGIELDFPTPMHTFDKTANRDSDTWTPEQRANVDYMTEVMESCGFRRIESEWWHFSDTDAIESFLVLNIPMHNVPLYTLDELYDMKLSFS